MSNLGLLVQVTRRCPQHTRSSFVSPGPFGTSHTMLSSTHKVVLCLTWAFWYKSFTAVLHTQGCPLSHLGLLVQVTRRCPQHTRSSFVSPGPFGTSHSLLSSTHKIVLCLTWTFWYKSHAAVLHTEGLPLSHLGLLVQVTHCCPPHTRSSFVPPGPFGTSHTLLSSTHKVVLCLTWTFWYKSFIAVLHTQGRPLSHLGLLLQVTHCRPPHSRSSFVSPGPFDTSQVLMSFTHKVVFNLIPDLPHCTERASEVFNLCGRIYLSQFLRI